MTTTAPTFVVLGAGRMGRAIAHVLVKAKGVAAVRVVDAVEAAAKSVGEQLGGCAWEAGDLREAAVLRRVLAGAKVAISASDYSLNAGITRVCIELGVHFCDLGGNNTIVAAQRAMSADAEKAGVTIIPDCGLAPGLAVLLAHRAVELLGGSADKVQIRVGGLPAQPKLPLNYSLVFAVRGLTNEYLEPSEVLRNGELQTVECMTEIEPVVFPAPFGELECFHTSGGASTLTETLRGKVRDLDYKTIRYKGHCTIIKAMIDLGFLSSTPIELPIAQPAATADGYSSVTSAPKALVEPRVFTEQLFVKSLSHGDDDWVLVRAEAVAASGKKLTYELMDRKDAAVGHSAMMRTTGYPTAVIALFLADGRISKRGVMPGELCVPVDDLIAELAALGVKIAKTE